MKIWIHLPSMSIKLSELNLSTSKFLANSLVGGLPGGRGLFILFKNLSVSSVTSPLLSSWIALTKVSIKCS